jgi:L-alanine-DL-glutamate epimerase-like enolase superfamily enzyme
MSAVNRRDFLRAALGAAGAGVLSHYYAIAAPKLGRNKIADVKVMVMQGPDRNYTLIRVDSDSGHSGIGEAYGTPGVGVKEGVFALKPLFVGRDPLDIDAIYSVAEPRRTDGSAHMLLRSMSGIEMAVWDLNGRILNQPAAKLLGGRFRDKVRMYNHAGPRNMLDRQSCREWAERVKADPAGFTAHKFGLPRTRPDTDPARDAANRILTSKELDQVRRGFENCREAVGMERDILVHCHWEYGVRTAIQIAEAVAPMKPYWLEDPMIVDYSESWKRLTGSSPVPICTGENLARREGFKDFIVNSAVDILHPDLRNAGGFLETKRIADLAHIWGIPMATHNTGSLVCTLATAQWAGSIRDYTVCETIVGRGGWMDNVVLGDKPPIRNGYIELTDKPGIGVELNPDVVRAHLAAGEQWWG